MNFIIGCVLGILFIFILFCAYAYVSKHFWRFMPNERLKGGDKMHVYVNGKYDRNATITGVSENSVSIYETVALPVDFRGSFYAIGKDSVDAKLVYVKFRRHYRFVKLCELLRKGFAVEDDEKQLVPDAHLSESDEAKEETEAEDEM